MRAIEVQINGEVIRAFAEKREGRLWLHMKGRTRVFDLRQKKGSSSESKAEVSGKIIAPMPGKILKVNVKKGDKVSSGHVVIVMEAMKMEYSLASEVTGEVKFISCAEGDQVDISSVLVEIEAVKEAAP